MEARLANADQAYDGFYLDYPELDKHLTKRQLRSLGTIIGQISLTHIESAQHTRFAAAVAKERARFTSIL